MTDEQEPRERRPPLRMPTHAARRQPYANGAQFKVTEAQAKELLKGGGVIKG